MQFPLNLVDICYLLAFTSAILLFTTIVGLPYWEKNMLPINKKRLRNITIATSIAFLMFAMAIVCGLAGGMAIFVAMLMNVIQRLKEYATLKATGWQNHHVLREVTYESLMISISGGVIGFLFGWILVLIIQQLSLIPLNVFNFRTIITIVSFTLILGIIGGLVPAQKATKASPIVILREG